MAIEQESSPLIKKLKPSEVAQHFLTYPDIDHSYVIFDSNKKRGLIGEVLHLAQTPEDFMRALDWGRNDYANYALMADILDIPKFQAWLITFTARGNTPQFDLVAKALTEPASLIGESAPSVFSFWSLIENYNQENWTRLYRRMGKVEADFRSLVKCDSELSEKMVGNYNPDRDFEILKNDPSGAATAANDIVMGDEHLEGQGSSLLFNTAWRFTQNAYKTGIGFPMSYFTGAVDPEGEKKPGHYEFAETVGEIASLATCEIVGARVILERGGNFTYLPYFDDSEGKPLNIDWIQSHPYVL